MKGESTSDHQDENLSPSDRRLIDTVRMELGPGDRSPVERAAFRARLEERIADRPAPFWQPFRIATTTAVAAMAAAAFWIAQPSVENEFGIDSTPSEALLAPETKSTSLLAFAYYETDYLGSVESEEDFLPDDFQAIASAFDVP